MCAIELVNRLVSLKVIFVKKNVLTPIAGPKMSTVSFSIAMPASWHMIISVCSQSDNPTNVGFLKYCRISSDYEQYRSLLSDFNISDGDATGMSYVVIDTGHFSRQVHFH